MTHLDLDATELLDISGGDCLIEIHDFPVIGDVKIGCGIHLF